jgi:gamma-glutamyltranspeptidase/glutathione hydrolase
VFAPGTGVQLNNVMGEADLHPEGYSATRPGVRIGSMMAPTLLTTADGTRTALGSGGSERIRSALLCAVSALVDGDRSLTDAVLAPRLHWDRQVLQVEPGLPDDALAVLRAARPCSSGSAATSTSAGCTPCSGASTGRWTPPGDPRRAGAAVVVDV